MKATLNLNDKSGKPTKASSTFEAKAWATLCQFQATSPQSIFHTLLYYFDCPIVYDQLVERINSN